MEALTPTLHYISDIIALIGGAIILIGVMVSAFRLTVVEIAALRRIDIEHDRQSLRQHFGYYILLGLEFIIAADVLRTLIHPGWEELLTLAVVVVIRTVISVTLNWELSRATHIRNEHP
ncbi:MAG: DUF1622 domain-containing protein [Opitutales bacterium]